MTDEIEIILVWAAAPSGLIGRDNWMPWRPPDDLRRFKAMTLHGCVLMGHRTFRSLGSKPLPERLNLVMRRRADAPLPGARTVSSVDEAIAQAREGGYSRLWVVGGSQIYNLALPRADRLEMTLVDDPDPLRPQDICFSFRADRNWRLVRASFHPRDDRHSHSFSFLTYERLR